MIRPAERRGVSGKRSSSRLLAATMLVGGLLLGSWMAGAAAPRFSPEELTNPFLGIDYSQWLVGPIARMASEKERKVYLELTDDALAVQFIEQFWQRRNPFPDEPGNQSRERFAERAAEADRKFSEAGYAGRRTARGTVWVLYGPPTESSYEVEKVEQGRPLEVWTYDASAPQGLDGRRPERMYRFVKDGDLTVFLAEASRGPRIPARF